MLICRNLKNNNKSSDKEDLHINVTGFILQNQSVYQISHATYTIYLLLSGSDHPIIFSDTRTGIIIRCYGHNMQH